jgi:hypothetical protein
VLCLAPSLCDLFLFMCALQEGGTLSRAFSCYAVSPYHHPTCLVPGYRACPLCIVPASSSRPPPQFVTRIALGSVTQVRITSLWLLPTSTHRSGSPNGPCPLPLPNWSSAALQGKIEIGKNTKKNTGCSSLFFFFFSTGAGCFDLFGFVHCPAHYPTHYHSHYLLCMCVT